MSDQHALYRFYNAAGSLLYVGITHHPDSRWRAHKKRDWWQDVANITLEAHPTREAVLAAEKAAIMAERPLFNVVHNKPARRAPKAHPGRDQLADCRFMDCPACNRYFSQRDCGLCPHCSVQLVMPPTNGYDTTEPAYIWTGQSWRLEPAEKPLTRREIAQIERALATPGHWGPVL